jgi:glycosyltransferase involved in cell wall biosynthesis
MEVVVVDDCSDHPCHAVVEAYRNKGMNITLLMNSRRLNTKGARLAGVTAAKGKYVGFADADDTLIGQGVLLDNLFRIDASGADVLHFRSILLDTYGKFVSYFIQADPFGSEIYGEEIFKNFIATDITSGAVIWNKIFEKKLIIDSLDLLEKANIEFYCEDLFLNSALMFNANKYINSNSVGYGYTFENKIENESLGRSLAMYTILEYMIPYFYSKNCDDETIISYIKKINLGIGNCMGRLCLQLVDSRTGLIREDIFSETLCESDKKKLLKAFILGGAVNAKKLRSCFRILTGLAKPEI